jgi:autotransporter passenger strand-loop-strand repeat protein
LPAVYITPGQSISNLTITSNSVIVDGGGTIINFTLIDAKSYLYSAASAISTHLAAKGEQIVYTGGVASDTFINSGGYEFDGGTSTDAIIGSGGFQDVTFKGVASGVVVQYGGEQALGELISFGYPYGLYGGSSFNTVLSGGAEVVDGGSLAVGTTVLSRGLFLVGDTPERIDLAGGPVASGVVVSNGGSAIAIHVTSGVYWKSGKVLESVVFQGGTEVTSYGAADKFPGYTVTKTEVGAGEVLRIVHDASGTQVSSATFAGTLDNGGVISNAVIESGGLFQFFGGSAVNLVTNAGAKVQIGGPMLGHVTSIFGDPVVESGFVVSSGVTEIVASGGTDDLGRLSSGAKSLVSSAGLASQTTVGGGATMVIYSGGVASAVQDLGAQLVSNGGVASGVVVADGGAQTIESGGLAKATVVSSGGREVLAAGGVASGSVISAGGLLSGKGEIAGVTSVGGVAKSLGVGAGATLDIVAGGVGSRISVTSGGALNVAAGGFSVSAVIESGGAISGGGVKGALTLSSGAHASAVTLMSGAKAVVHGGAIETGVIVSSGATLELLGVTISAGQTLTAIRPSAPVTISGATVEAGGAVTTVSAIVLSGAIEADAAGGVISAGTVKLGGTVSGVGSLAGSMLDSGAVDGVTLGSGARLTVAAGGTTRGVKVAAGGQLLMSAGATAASALVEAGGVLSGGEIVAGTLTVSSGASAEGVGVDSGAIELLLAGGVDTGVTISGGATLRVAGVSISAGQTLTAGSQGVAITIDGASVLAGGVIGTLSATILGGGVEVVASGGSALSTSIASGGALVVDAGAVASRGTVAAGGVLSGSGSLAGSLTVLGRIDGLTVARGGAAHVSAGGSAVSLRIGSGATLQIDAGGLADSISLSAGGVAIDNGVMSVGAASVVAAGVLSGGGALVMSGAHAFKLTGTASAFTGQAIISAGVFELDTSGGFGAASIAFAGVAASAAELYLAALNAPSPGGAFATALANFSNASDKLDIAGHAFVSGATAKRSGTALTVTDGAYKATFTLTGATDSAYTVISDGHAGLLIAGKSAAPAARRLAEALANISPSSGALAAARHCGDASGAASGAVAMPHTARPRLLF